MDESDDATDEVEEPIEMAMDEEDDHISLKNQDAPFIAPEPVLPEKIY